MHLYYQILKMKVYTLIASLYLCNFATNLFTFCLDLQINNLFYFEIGSDGFIGCITEFSVFNDCIQEKNDKGEECAEFG